MTSPTMPPVNDPLLGPLASWQHSLNQCKVAGFHRATPEPSQRVHFLHGTGFCAMTLSEMASHLPQDWELWLTDVPGHGLSSQPNHKMPDWPALADQVAQALIHNADIEKNGPVVGVGHSMGGVLTLFAAAKYPQLFSQIILLDPVLFNTEIIIAQQLARKTGIWKKSGLVRSVSNRTASWSSKEDMLNALSQKQLYRLWTRETLNQFCDYAAQEDENGKMNLCCNPKWEASIFGSYPKGLWNAVRKLDIKVDLLIANKSYSFIPKAAKKAAKINKHISWHAFGDHHCFPMEQPQASAEKLKQLIK